MEAMYRISEEDYLEASKLFARLTKKSIVVISAVLVILVFGAIFGPPFLRGGAIGGLGAGVIVIVVGRLIVSPFMARRHYRKYKAIHDKFSVELTEGGIRFSSSTGTGTVTWPNIFKWRENDRYILLYPMPRMYHIIPKSIEQSGFNIAALRQELIKHVGNQA